MASKPAATETTATAKPKSKWVKRALVTAFAVAVGMLALDDLGLRIENEELATGVNLLLEENANLQEQLNNGGGGDVIVVPRDNNTKIMISAPAKTAKPAVQGQKI